MVVNIMFCPKRNPSPNPINLGAVPGQKIDVIQPMIEVKYVNLK